MSEVQEYSIFIYSFIGALTDKKHQIECSEKILGSTTNAKRADLGWTALILTSVILSQQWIKSGLNKTVYGFIILMQGFKMLLIKCL